MIQASQLKVLARRIAAQHQTSVQVVLQLHMMEVLLARIAASPYRNNFVLKGGFLISSLIGVRNRTTMDLDATAVGLPVNVASIKRVFVRLCSSASCDEPVFSVVSVSDIRESDDYGGVRVALECRYGMLVIPMKFDVTAGDAITPGSVEHEHVSLLDGRVLRLPAYNVETLLAEKIETVLSRSIQNTRMRDFYDIHVLTRGRKPAIALPVLAEALNRTAAHRHSSGFLSQAKEIIAMIRGDAEMARRWENYRRTYSYADNLEFSEVCASLRHVFERLAVLLDGVA